MDIQKLIEMAAGGQSPVSHPQPHPLDPNQPKRNMQTGNQILDMLNQMTGGQRGHGSDADMMEVGNTMDGMSEASILAEIMGGPRPGEGRDQAAPGWDYDTASSVLDATGRDVSLLDELDEETLNALLEELAGFDPNQVTATIQEAEKAAAKGDDGGDGIYDLGPQQVPPMLLELLAGREPTKFTDRERKFDRDNQD